MDILLYIVVVVIGAAVGNIIGHAIYSIFVRWSGARRRALRKRHEMEPMKPMGLWRESDWYGIKVPGTMFCRICNVAVPTDAEDRICTPLRFCPRCGFPQFKADDTEEGILADDRKIVG